MKNTKVQTLSGNHVDMHAWIQFFCGGNIFWQSKTQKNQITPSREGWMRGARCRHRLAIRQWRVDQNVRLLGLRG